ncbi:uncharacterized protein LOC143244025 [Tachypleus tridentatus]|uniref:uncharacterized protein LOC143244025 n=1 Tax=Tachypleus tridentatus TaxID=6853 RepID=UPI003FD29B6F
MMSNLSVVKLLAGILLLHSGNCQLTTHLEIKETPVNETASECTGLQDGAYVDYQQACRAFFVCDSGKKYKFWCGDGMMFNPESACDSPNSFKCLAPKKDVSQSLAEDCSQQEDGVYTSYSKDCQSFYFCRGGRKVEYSCPTGKRFDWRRGRCRPSEEVTCSRLDCLNKTGGIYADITEDCRRYYRCGESEVQEFICPARMVFNEKTRNCTDFLETDCGDPQEFLCNGLPDGYYPVYTRMCHAFQVCEGGISRKYSCPYPLVFNPDSLACENTETNVCTFPQTADCKDKPNGVYPRYDNGCREFEVCRDGNLVQLGFCADGKLLDPATGTCEPRSQVVCAPTQDPDCNDHSDGAYPAEDSQCTSFYVCINHQKVIESSCPPSTLFDSVSGLCLSSRVIKCQTTGTISSTPLLHWDISHYGCEGRLGLYADFLSSCQKFQVCAYGQQNVSKCPEKKRFNQITGQCENTTTVDCRAPALLGTFLCKKGDEGIYVDVKSRCKKWHECWGEMGATYRCPSGQTFNPISRSCDSASEASCGQVTARSYRLHANISRVVRANLVPESSFNCSDKSNGIFALGERNCRMFHVCTNGLTVSFMCPSDLVYNPNLESCDDPAAFACESLAEKVEPPQLEFTCKGEADGYYPDFTTNCTRYYICKEERKTTVYCPETYLFNILTESCESGDGMNVKCDPSEVETVRDKSENDTESTAQRSSKNVDNVITSDPKHGTFDGSEGKRAHVSEQGFVADNERHVNPNRRGFVPFDDERHYRAPSQQFSGNLERNLESQYFRKYREKPLQTNHQEFSPSSEGYLYTGNHRLTSGVEGSEYQGLSANLKRPMYDTNQGFTTDQERYPQAQSKKLNPYGGNPLHTRSQQYNPAEEYYLHTGNYQFTPDEERSLYTMEQKFSLDNDRPYYSRSQSFTPEEKTLYTGNQGFDQYEERYTRNEDFRSEENQSGNQRYSLDTYYNERQTYNPAEEKNVYISNQWSSVDDEMSLASRAYGVSSSKESNLNNWNEGLWTNDERSVKTPLQKYKRKIDDRFYTSDELPDLKYDGTLQTKRTPQSLRDTSPGRHYLPKQVRQAGYSFTQTQNGNYDREVAENTYTIQETEIPFVRENLRTRSRHDTNDDYTRLLSNSEEFFQGNLEFGDRLPEYLENSNAQVYQNEETSLHEVRMGNPNRSHQERITSWGPSNRNLGNFENSGHEGISSGSPRKKYPYYIDL